MILTHGANSVESGGDLPAEYELLDYIETTSTDPNEIRIVINDSDLNKINLGAGDKITHVNYLPACGNNDPQSVGFFAGGTTLWDNDYSHLGTCGCTFGVIGVGDPVYYQRARRAGWPGLNDKRDSIASIWGEKVTLELDSSGVDCGTWHNVFGNTNYLNDDIILHVLQRYSNNGYGWNTSVKTGIKFYSFLCERNGNIRLKFLPVRRKADSVLGVYEYVGGKFFAAPSSYIAGELT